MTYQERDGIALVTDYLQDGLGQPYLQGEASGGDCTYAFMDALATGRYVFVPPSLGFGTVFDVALSSLPDGAVIFSHSALPDYDTGSLKMAVILHGISGADAVVDTSGCKGYNIFGIGVEGYGSREMQGIGAVSSDDWYGKIEGVEVRNCSNGIGGKSGAYMYATKVINCQSRINNFGFSHFIDAQLNGVVSIANLKSGLYLPSGCNRNQVSGGRFEWNNEYGVYISAAHENAITGGISDRNGGAGILYKDVDGLTVVGGNYSRNGRLYDETTAAHLDGHFRPMGINTSISITGMVTAVGEDDGGGGLMSPQNVFSHAALSVSDIHADGMFGGSVNPMNGGAIDPSAKVSMFDRSGANAPFIQNMPYSVVQM